MTDLASETAMSRSVSAQIEESTRLERAARVLLMIAVFLTPTVFDKLALKVFDVPKFVTLWIFGWLAFGAWVINLVRTGKRPAPSLFGRLAWAYVGVLALATIFSTTRLVSFFGYYGRFNGFVTTLLLVCMFTVILHLYRGRPEWVGQLVYELGLASIALVLYILVQRFNLDPLTWARPSGKAPGQAYFGTMGNANFAGGLLGLTAPWLYYAFRRAVSTPKRIGIAAWAVVHLAALVMTGARNGLAALGAAAVVLAIAHRDQIPRWTKIAAVAGTATMVLVTAFAIWHPGLARAPGPLGTSRLFRSRTLEVRGYWWQAGLKIVASRPIFGTGPETYVKEYHRHISLRAAGFSDAEKADAPHNVFVERAVSGGLVGFGVYVALIVLAFWRGFRKLPALTGHERVLLTTALALLGGYLGQALFSIDVIPLAMCGWLALGLVAVLSGPAVSETATVPTGRRAAVRIGAATVALVVLAAGLVAYGGARLLGEHEIAAGLKGKANGDLTDDVLAHFRRGMALQPYEPFYHGLAGDFLMNHADDIDDPAEKREFLEASVVQFRKMAAQHPNFHLWEMTLAQAMGKLAAIGGSTTFQDSQALFERAERQAPIDWRVPVAYSEMLSTWGYVTKSKVYGCQALIESRKAVALRPTEPKPWISMGNTLSALRRYRNAVPALQRAVAIAELDAEQAMARVALDRVQSELAEFRSKGVTPRPLKCR